MLLSKKSYNSWREIQDEYDNYKASLEFVTIEEIEDYTSSRLSKFKAIC